MVGTEEVPQEVFLRPLQLPGNALGSRPARLWCAQTS